MTTIHVYTAALSADGQTRERVTLTVASDGGYVYRCFPDGRKTQVCDGLQPYGDTLRADGASLASVVRRHLRQARRIAAKGGR